VTTFFLSEEGSGKTVVERYTYNKVLTSNFFDTLLYKRKEPYLKTTPSKLVEYTKAFEWTIIKELGKLTTVT